MTVGVGPGIIASNVRSTYDDATGTGTVTFDLTAAADAPAGNNEIGIFWGHQRCATVGANIPLCRVGVSGPSDVTVSACQTGITQVYASAPAGDRSLRSRRR